MNTPASVESGGILKDNYGKEDSLSEVLKKRREALMQTKGLKDTSDEMENG